MQKSKMVNPNISTSEYPIELLVFDRFEDIESIQCEWDKFMESVGGEIFLNKKIKSLVFCHYFVKLLEYGPYI
jgi:hypothetical protein